MCFQYQSLQQKNILGGREMNYLQYKRTGGNTDDLNGDERMLRKHTLKMKGREKCVITRV